ncbi:ABC transporter ATP-binding protein [Dysosmobacter sp.]|jgi:ATP-binding cassette subfamily B multidrug efflux pump|uniref:ABC transporter ATP-binding protein n=1 Tax=Dysosmobacter sp. TaxID=2591382 RepID=UPI003D8D01CF
MLRYLKKYWLYCLLAPLFMLGEIAMDMWQPAMMAIIVDEGVLGGELSVIWSEGLRMLLLVAFGGTCGVLCGVFANVAAQRFGNDVRKDLFARVMDFSFQQTDQFTTGSLVTRITNDVTQVEQMVMMSVRSAVRCVLMFFGGIYMLYLQSPRFALVAACGLPVIAAFVILFLRAVSPLFTVIQQRLDQINCAVQENLAGARVVKAYVKEERALEQFSKANDGLCSVNLQAQTKLAFLNPCVNMVLNLCTVGVLYVGGVTVQTGGGVTPGQVMAAITYLSLILMRVIFMANIFQTFTRAAASWKRIQEVLDTQPILRLGTVSPRTQQRGEIEFRHVSFAYPDAPDQPVLRDISFRVEPGQTVAIIGSTGSGKSSLIQLIPRFYDAAEGQVLVDGVDVKAFPLEELRDKVGFVQQQAELFSRSIQENIAWGAENADKEMVRRAARIAQAEDFILRTPAGYDTKVTESGHSLSGGQKQRLCIARAVLKRPEILIMDDASSALDLKTEAALHGALSRELTGTTKVIVAQRVASVKNADKILVLEDGRLSACGTHQELLRTSAVYGEICRSQLKQEVSAS